MSKSVIIGLMSVLLLSTSVYAGEKVVPKRDGDKVAAVTEDTRPELPKCDNDELLDDLKEMVAKRFEHTFSIPIKILDMSEIKQISSTSTERKCSALVYFSNTNESRTPYRRFYRKLEVYSGTISANHNFKLKY